MTQDEKLVYILAWMAAISFGIWKHSFFAGLFCFTVIGLLWLREP